MTLYQQYDRATFFSFILLDYQKIILLGWIDFAIQRHLDWNGYHMRELT